MRLFLLVAKLAALAYLATLLLFLLTEFAPEQAGYRPPFGLFILDTINLFIHEAGHFFLGLFGRWISILGGSLTQVLLPLLLLLVTIRQNIGQSAWPAFWTGESLVNVSAYVRDAPHMQLKLIARGLTHDWNYLLSGHLELAEPLADTLYVLGLGLCATAIGAGIYFAVRAFREFAPVVPNLPR
jgi:hypothetical protein